MTPRGRRGVGKFLFPSKSPTCSRLSLKARSKQADSDLALMGHPNAFPSIPKASASDWTIMQSLRVETLRHTMALKAGKCRTWKMAADQLTKEAGDMRV